jgi:raffinose/stachyose/melibiose transport system permease protein
MKTTTRVILGLFFIAASAFFVYPLLWMVLLSFKTQSEMYTNAFGLPRVWMFSNYAKALTEFAFLRYFMNSVIYAIGSVTLTLLAGSLFAYAAARMRWKLRGTLLGYVTLGLTIPLQVIIIPLFLVLKYGHLTNTYPGLILPLTAYLLPMTILIFYGFMRTLPSEVEEAAFMEGSGMGRLFFGIVLPLI